MYTENKEAATTKSGGFEKGLQSLIHRDYLKVMKRLRELFPNNTTYNNKKKGHTALTIPEDFAVCQVFKPYGVDPYTGNTIELSKN